MTVVTHNRLPIFHKDTNIQILRKSFQKIRAKRPFHIDAIVIMPDHIHCIWALPEKDSDFSTRWRLIKSDFSKNMSTKVKENGEKKIWQPRFWEHLIRDENDLHRHINYIHYNPVKHKYVRRPEEWSYSSYHRLIARGFCSDFRQEHVIEDISKLDFE